VKEFGVEPTDQPTQEPGGSRETAAELTLLRTLINNYDGSPPSRVDVEAALQSGAARLMWLEGRRRAQASRENGTRSSEGRREDHDLVEEIRALQEAVAELRKCAFGESAPLGYGFVLPRDP
jgi:hypothetical protein